MTIMVSGLNNSNAIFATNSSNISAPIVTIQESGAAQSADSTTAASDQTTTAASDQTTTAAEATTQGGR